VATGQSVISADPGDGAYRTDLAEAAASGLETDGFDVVGASWEPVTVELREGGE